MDIITQITDIIEANLSREDLYIVELTFTGDVMKKLSIRLDGEIEGISIDECGKISRLIGNHIEENNLLEDAYNLEVSSPGLDQPLKLLKQYTKNISRDLSLVIEGKELSGRLEAVNDSSIKFTPIKMRGKIKAYAKESMTIEFDKIDKANILISFN